MMMDRAPMFNEWSDFIAERDRLLQSKTGQSAINLAADLVHLMELLAVHGSSGIEGDDAKRQSYTRTLAGRIRSAV